MIFLERTREGHRQSDEHWNRFKANVGEASESIWSAYGLFRAPRDYVMYYIMYVEYIILNWTKLNWRQFGSEWLVVFDSKSAHAHFNKPLRKDPTFKGHCDYIRTFTGNGLRESGSAVMHVMCIYFMKMLSFILWRCLHHRTHFFSFLFRFSNLCSKSSCSLPAWTSSICVFSLDIIIFFISVIVIMCVCVCVCVHVQ